MQEKDVIAHTFIQHVTVNSGNNNPYNRFKCDPKTINNFKYLIEASAKHPSPISFPYSNTRHLKFSCHPQGNKLSVATYAPNEAHEKGKPYIGNNLTLLSTFAVAPTTDESSIWNDLYNVHNTIFNKIKITECPQAPWVAVVIYPSILEYQECIKVLSDFERCMALAWLDMV